MRIAVTGFRGIPASWGGVEHQCEQVYTRLAAKGYEIIIFARSHYVKKDIKFYKGIRIRRLPTIRIKGLEAFLHTFLAVLIILKENPDIVHFYTQGPSLFSWLPRLFRPQMRVFFTCQGLDWQRKKWSPWAAAVIYLGEVFSALFPHNRIVVSQALQSYYQKRYGVQTHYIPNGVQIPVKKTLHEARRFGILRRRYFLSVGRMVPEKRLEDIIGAFISKPRQSMLVIVGGGAGAPNYENKLKQLAKDHPAIVFVGYQFGEMLKELFSNARAFVTASELEGLPLTLLEALSYGLICITSDIGPHREILGRLNGFCFPTGSHKKLSDQMSRIDQMAEPELSDFGVKATERVERMFGWEGIVEQIEHLYQKSMIPKAGDSI